MACLTRPALAAVDPLDGCGNQLFPHHDPPNVVAVRPADLFSSEECANYLKNSGYVSV